MEQSFLCKCPIFQSLMVSWLMSSTSEGQLGESIDSKFDKTAAALRSSGCPQSLERLLNISLFLWRHLSYPVISWRKLTVAGGEKQPKFTKIVQIHRAFRCGCWSGQCASEHHVWSLALLMTPCWLYISTNRLSEIWREVWNSWMELTAASQDMMSSERVH